jgi:hypothetical protein
MCPASTATLVPAPMAMPMSAVARAGASLTPSPTMATRCPRAWSSRTFEASAARRSLQDALAAARAASAVLLEAETLLTLAAVHDRTGDDDRARRLSAEADSLFAQLGAVEWGKRIRHRLDLGRPSG